MHQIKLLTIKGCHNCELAKEMLDRHDLMFSEIDCDQDPNAIPESIRGNNVLLPILKVQDNHFIISNRLEYLQEIIQKLFGAS